MEGRHYVNVFIACFDRNPLSHVLCHWLKLRMMGCFQRLINRNQNSTTILLERCRILAVTPKNLISVVKEFTRAHTIPKLSFRQTNDTVVARSHIMKELHSFRSKISFILVVKFNSWWSHWIFLYVLSLVFTLFGCTSDVEGYRVILFAEHENYHPFSYRYCSFWSSHIYSSSILPSHELSWIKVYWLL